MFASSFSLGLVLQLQQVLTALRVPLHLGNDDDYGDDDDGDDDKDSDDDDGDDIASPPWP